MDAVYSWDLVSLARQLDLMSGLGPTAEILSFASPKESIQRKSHPDAAYSLRSEAFERGCRKGLPAPSATCGIHAAPLRAIPSKSSGARRGIREETIPAFERNFVFIKNAALTQ
ncbi:hypothetical protein JWZ98_02380 [Methylomonas sp. EFPC1]|uniref:hypothetical protein n=1 Tax=Methylomonas sp. EFPC1 TaxID=2812647 RepID=UPI001967BE82|nr:hypothetical protein [Methylomonas sp. EFPC1]QSB01828.1 hypothetical protein JWZ98_02380 [Methylomonas sp. EFPC1]